MFMIGPRGGDYSVNHRQSERRQLCLLQTFQQFARFRWTIATQSVRVYLWIYYNYFRYNIAGTVVMQRYLATQPM